MATRGRPSKEKNQIDKLNWIISKQDETVKQATDQISDLQGQVEFYRKQINHFLALLNILAKGS
jgi:chromosome segregation ATPase